MVQVTFEKYGIAVADNAKWKSSKGFFDYEGDFTIKWSNDGLAKLNEKSRTAVLTEVIKSFNTGYKKVVSNYEDVVRKELEKLEKDVQKMVDNFEKILKKKRVTEKEAQGVAQKIQQKKDTELARIKVLAEKKFKTVISELLKKAFDAACKKFKDASGLKWDVKKIIFTTLKILLVITAVAAAVVATVATAGAAGVVMTAIAGVALGFKLLGGAVSICNDIQTLRKSHAKAVDVASQEMANASKAMGNALKALEAAEQARANMVLKHGEAQRSVNEALNKAKESQSKGDLKEAQKGIAALEKARAEGLKFETKLAGKPDQATAALKKAMAEMVNSNPKAWADIGNANTYADAVKNATDVMAAIAKAVDVT